MKKIFFAGPLKLWRKRGCLPKIDFTANGKSASINPALDAGRECTKSPVNSQKSSLIKEEN